MRCERTLRAAAPHWDAILDAGLGEHIVYLYDSRPRAWLEELCQYQLESAVHMSEDGAGTLPAGGCSSASGRPSERITIPLLQLFACHMATLAKVARHDRRFCQTLNSHSRFLRVLMSQSAQQVMAAAEAAVDPSQQALATAAAAPSLVALLMPRCAALSAAVRDDCTQLPAITLLHAMAFVYVCQTVLGQRLFVQVLSSCHISTLLGRAAAEVRQPPQRARRNWHHVAIGCLAEHVQTVALGVHDLVSRECDGAPPGSPRLRDLLVQPLLQLLLGSPLLDQLVGLQHVMVDGGEASEAVLSRTKLLRLGPMNPAHLAPITDLPGKTLLVRGAQGLVASSRNASCII